MADSYSYITYAQFRQELANRLYDPTKQFWSDSELKSLTLETLRTWNALTSFWRGDFLFPSQPGLGWYDLTDATNLPNTLRPLTVTDALLYPDIQFALLEPAVGVNPWAGVSTQFTADDLINAVQRKRDEVLSVTGCFTTRRLVPAVAGRIALPDTVIDIRRMAYFPASLVTPADNFNRANQNPVTLDPRWKNCARLGNSSPGQVLSNQYVAQTTAGSAAIFGGTFNPNQFSQARLKALAVGSGYATLIICGNQGNPTSYAMVLDGTNVGNAVPGGIGQPTNCRIFDSTNTQLPNSVVIVPQLNDIFRVQIINGVISVFQNNVLLFTVPAPTLAGNPGLSIAPTFGAVTDIAWDDWSGGGFVDSSQSSVMWPEDTWAEQSFQQSYLQNPAGTPLTYLQSTEPPIAFDTDRAPGAAGSYELLTVEAGPILSATAPTTLIVPDDWTHVIKWGALGDLLGRESNARDPLRAQYCEQRYRMGLAMLAKSPALLALRIANTPLQIDSVRAGDTYRTGWQAEPAKQPDTAYHSGLNLIGLASTPDAGPYSLTATVVENAPIPANDAANLQVAREDLDAILDYAQHVASFKMGGAEFLSTMPLLEKFMKQAALYNAKLAELGEFTQPLYGLSQRQEQMAPRITEEAAS